MDEPIRALLRWLGAGDPVSRILLACPELPLTRVGRDTVVVRAEHCLADNDAGLPAQLLANGAEEVALLPCPAARPRTAGWPALLPEVIPFSPPPRGRRPREVLTLGSIPVPRRVVLGMRVQSALDLGLDDAARTLAAFRSLQDQGRATLPRGDTSPTGPLLSVAGSPGSTPAGGTATTNDPAEAPGDAVPAVPQLPAAGLAVSGCTACGVCVRACPHDALVLEHDGPSSTLTHLREDCRAELQCVTLCPVDAIASSGPLPLTAVLDEPTRVLAEVRTAVCERCSARHPAEEGRLCAACSFRTANVFGSALPPGVAEKLAAVRKEQRG